MKTLAIIGSTGSIGLSSLNIYKKNKKKFRLIFLAANTNLKKLKQQSLIYRPKKYFLLNNNGKYNYNKKFISLEKALIYEKKKIDFIISGMSGYDALSINCKLAKISKNLLIANKETLICGGKFFLNFAKKQKCNVIPIDSEHFSLFHFFQNSNFKSKIDKVYLIASGGPFFNKKKIRYDEKISNVLRHPNWKMGKKITIDSSNFANKVLELFEAKILFNIPSSKIKIMVEQTSNAHALIKLKNNFLFPIIHYPSMKFSISNALNLDSNIRTNINNLNLNFIKPDVKKFPIIKLGYDILNKYDHAAMILFTVFNEDLVKKFIDNKIKYGDIAGILLKLFSKKNIKNKLNTKINNLKDVMNLIEYGKKITKYENKIYF